MQDFGTKSKTKNIIVSFLIECQKDRLLFFTQFKVEFNIFVAAKFKAAILK